MMLLTTATAWADITISTPAEWETFATAVSNGTTYSGEAHSRGDDWEDWEDDWENWEDDEIEE